MPDRSKSGDFAERFDGSSIFDALKNNFNHIVVITKAANKSFLKTHLSERLPSNVKLDVLVQEIEDIPRYFSRKGFIDLAVNFNGCLTNSKFSTFFWC